MTNSDEPAEQYPRITFDQLQEIFSYFSEFWGKTSLDISFKHAHSKHDDYDEQQFETSYSVNSSSSYYSDGMTNHVFTAPRKVEETREPTIEELEEMNQESIERVREMFKVGKMMFVYIKIEGVHIKDGGGLDLNYIFEITDYLRKAPHIILENAGSLIVEDRFDDGNKTYDLVFELYFGSLDITDRND